jgi:plasmid stabilization system protein ParE
LSRHVVYQALADLELNAAARYYERESRGLGTAFLTEVQRCSDSILDHPSIGVLVRGDVRRRLVTRFPYALVCRVTSQQVRILAVMNLRWRPFYWVGRE